MKRIALATIFILAAVLCLTGCSTSANGSNAAPAEPLDISLAPEGFAFDSPEGYEEKTAEGNTTMYEKDGTRLSYCYSNVTVAVADIFSEEAATGDSARLSKQYSHGMGEYEVATVAFFGKTGLRLTGVMTEDYGAGRTGDETVRLILPVGGHIIQYESYGPEAKQVADHILQSASYTPTATQSFYTDSSEDESSLS